MSIVGVENFESFLPRFFDVNVTVHKEFTKKLADSIDKC